MRRKSRLFIPLSVSLALGLILWKTSPTRVEAQQVPASVYFSSNCSTYTPNPSFGSPPAGQAICFDTTQNSMYVWNGTVFALPTSFPAMCSGQLTLASGSAVATPTCLSGVGSSALIVCSQASGVQPPAVGCSIPTPGEIAVAQASPTGAPIVNWALVHK